MLLIVDDQTVCRVRGPQFTIGSDASNSVRLKGAPSQACSVYQTAGETWRLRTIAGEIKVHTAGRTTQLSSAGEEIAIETPFEIFVGRRSVAAPESLSQGGLSERLRAAAFEVERSVQMQILNAIQFEQGDDSQPGKRQRLEREMKRTLDDMSGLADETGNYMARQALGQFLSDRITHYKEAETNWREDEAKAFEPMLKRLENALGTADDKTEVEKQERIELLLPWLLRKPEFSPDAKDSRRLAEALIRTHLRDLVFGYGPLQDFFRAPGVSDIMVLPSGKIFIEKAGTVQDSGRIMFSPRISDQVVQKIVKLAQNREMNQSRPMVDARLSDGSRLNAVIEPVSISGPALTIRRFPETRMRMDDLLRLETLTQGARDFLIHCVRTRKSIVVSGGTGSGKTTLLSALSDFILRTERIVTIEDTAELKLSQTHVVALQSRPPNRDGKDEVTIYDLVRNSLRMRPDRIIVGECRGPEALDMLQAMNTGHEGSMTTVHANSPADALRRLEVMALAAKNIDLPLRAIRGQIASAIDLVVQIGRVASGGRRVEGISEVVEYDEEDDVLIVEDIYSCRKRKGASGSQRADLRFSGYVPSFFDELLQSGVKVECLCS